MTAYIVVIRSTGGTVIPRVTVTTEPSQIAVERDRVTSFKETLHRLSGQNAAFSLKSGETVMRGEFWTSRLKP